MWLIFIIFAISLIISFSSPITKPLIDYLLSPGARQRQLTAEIAKLRRELATISMSSQYTDYVRLERRIATHERELATYSAQLVTRKLLITYGVPYGTQAALFFVLLLIAAWYRYSPVIVLGDAFNFAPFGWLMAFPTGVAGAVSVPFWVFVSGFMASNVAAVCGV